MENYDVLIIGGGVAGMSAAVYAKRSGRSVAIIEKMSLGGIVNTLSKIENFPSQQQIDGVSLSQMFAKQVESHEIDVIYDDVISANLSGEVKAISGKMGKYSAKRVILATGMDYLPLGQNESDFLGRGVSYCAVCDGNFFKGKTVSVVSRNGSGIKDAKYLSSLASEVLLLEEADASRFAAALKENNIKVLSNVKVEKVIGSAKVEEVLCTANGKQKRIKTDAVFICLGRRPQTKLFGSGLELDAQGFIKTDSNMQTNLKGVYAVGDLRSGVMKQIVTACSDGAIAGQKAVEGL